MTNPFVWVGRHELATLVMWLLAAGAILAFAVLADAVADGQTHVFDRELLLVLRNPADLSDPLDPEWVEEILRDFTALGGKGVLMLVTLSATAYFLLEGRYPEAGLLLVAVVGGILLSTLLKLGFDRPRPDLVPHMSHVITASFPSGHTKLSAVTYLTLGALHIRLWGETIRVAAAVHTVGGLSAHADQAGLLKWRSKIENRPPVALVHGEEQAANGLSECLQERFGVPVRVARPEWSG